jgi:hypothetical protein
MGNVVVEVGANGIFGRWIPLGHRTNFARWNRAVGSVVIGDAGVFVLGSRERNAGGLTGVCVWRCRSQNEVIVANDRIDVMSEKRDDVLR